jgi:GNAT superfamily N-acetyltransferase
MGERMAADSIFLADSPSHYSAFGGLVREYVAWLRGRYRDEAWFVDQVLGHQSLDRELEGLAEKYGPPKGKVLLARHKAEICGCVAYHRLGGEICEMKRLFVPDRFRGHGYGRKLCDALIRSAKEENFKVMRLDTGNLLTEAIAMYESIGFRRCAPYQQYPEKLMPYIVFMEMPLTSGEVQSPF